MPELMSDKQVAELAVRRGRPTKYPWDDWTDGQWRTFKRGTPEQCELPAEDPDHADFAVDIETFRVNASEIAKPRNLKVETRKVGDDQVAIRFLPKPKEQPTDNVA